MQRKYGYQKADGSYAAFDFDPDKAMAGQLASFYKPEYFTKAGSGIKALADVISIVKHASAAQSPLLTAEERVNQATEKFIAALVEQGALLRHQAFVDL